MQCFEGYASIPKEALKGAVVTIGNFDGLHLGHQELIKQAKIMAKRLCSLVVAYTFSPHPARLLSQNPPQLLMTDKQKRLGFEQLGLDAAIFEPFTLAFSQLSAASFLQKVLIDSLGVAGVVVGDNFSFGHKGQGNAAMLQNELSHLGVEVQIVAPVLLGGQICSSGRIRGLILSGQVDDAALVLGQFFTLEGVVVHGDGRGRSIGFPSATLQTEQELFPASGVYATLIQLPGRQKPLMAATNIGCRPTFKNDQQIYIETHILDFDQIIYGESVKISFVKKIREEIKFQSVDALKDQIQADLLKIRLLAKANASNGLNIHLGT